MSRFVLTRAWLVRPIPWSRARSVTSAILAAVAAMCFSTAPAQTPPGPDAPDWGAYRSGLGYPVSSDALVERADEEGIDPRCLMTITIAWDLHPRIVANVANGLMEVLVSGVTRAEAQAVLMEESPYFNSDIDCTGASPSAWTGGIYRSTYGDIDFGAGGTRGRGVYGGSHDGVIVYTLNGRTMNGTWIQPSSAQRCGSTREGSEYWGWIEFEFEEDFGAWTGTWGYCDDDEVQGAWTGTLDE